MSSSSIKALNVSYKTRILSGVKGRFFKLSELDKIQDKTTAMRITYYSVPPKVP